MRIGGVLKDAEGQPRLGTYRVAFSIYAAPEGGSSLLTEMQEIEVGANARYEVLLGSSRLEGFPIELLGSGQPLWLGIQVGEETEQSPRMMLVSSAPALKGDDAATGLSLMATTDDVFTATANPGPGFISQATSGPPLQVGSTDKVANLNVDLLDDLDSTAFAQLAAANTFTANQTINGDLSLGGAVSLPTVVRVTAGDFPFLHNVAAFSNTFLGLAAGNFTMTGAFNTAIGESAFRSNTEGSSNTASGFGALFGNTTGSGNTATGQQALNSNGGGNNNTANGFQALFNNTVSFNTATGAFALFSNTQGSSNTANGVNALFSNTLGSSNTAIGVNALRDNTEGASNTASGANALSNNTGSGNTASGFNALASNTTGSNNIAVGSGAGIALTTGSNNIHIGNAGVAGEEGTIRIGTANQTGRTFIAGIVSTAVGGAEVVRVTADGQLGTVFSSARFKERIRDMGEASSGLLKLRPVTFHYKDQPKESDAIHFGLVAEEVDEVLPELVVHESTGETRSVRYDEMPAMLLNELQKQQRRIEEQQEQIAAQQRFIKSLEERLARLENGPARYK